MPVGYACGWPAARIKPRNRRMSRLKSAQCAACRRVRRLGLDVAIDWRLRAEVVVCVSSAPPCRLAIACCRCLGVVRRARRRSRQRAHRRAGDRPHRRGRAPAHRKRPHPGLDRARRRRHRAPHRGARARGQHQLGGVRARQQQRRADRPADRRAALPHGRLRPVLARPRPVAHRQHHAELRRPAGSPGQRHRRHLPHHARSRHRHHLRRRAAHRQAAAALSVGAGRLQGQGQLASRSTTASSSASPACWRCSSPSCSWSRAA